MNLLENITLKDDFTLIIDFTFYLSDDPNVKDNTCNIMKMMNSDNTNYIALKYKEDKTAKLNKQKFMQARSSNLHQVLFYSFNEETSNQLIISSNFSASTIEFTLNGESATMQEQALTLESILIGQW